MNYTGIMVILKKVKIQLSFYDLADIFLDFLLYEESIPMPEKFEKIWSFFLIINQG